MNTPTPWRARKSPDYGVEWEAVIDVGDGQLVVAATFGGTGPEGSEDNAQDNAEHIVRCVNSHAELLSALRQSVEALRCGDPNARMNALRDTPAVIARATGAKP